jgi:hypothetical protein
VGAKRADFGLVHVALPGMSFCQSLVAALLSWGIILVDNSPARLAGEVGEPSGWLASITNFSLFKYMGWCQGFAVDIRGKLLTVKGKIDGMIRPKPALAS